MNVAIVLKSLPNPAIVRTTSISLQLTQSLNLMGDLLYSSRKLTLLAALFSAKPSCLVSATFAIFPIHFLQINLLNLTTALLLVATGDHFCAIRCSMVPDMFNFVLYFFPCHSSKHAANSWEKNCSSWIPLFFSFFLCSLAHVILLWHEQICCLAW